MIDLNSWGWDDYFWPALPPSETKDLIRARVLEQHKTEFVLMTENGDCRAGISGRMRNEIEAGQESPVVGDWVLISPLPSAGRAIIQLLLPRRTCFVRKAAGSSVRAQAVAANLDYVFLVSALDHDFNIRRNERYLTMAWESGAHPVAILTKADLCADTKSRIEDLEAVAYGVPVHAISSHADAGLDALKEYFTRGKTAVLLGSSGVGKSTLVNKLTHSDQQKVNIVGDDDSGKHTTTSRQLIMLPGGGMIIDTPGMRELGMWRDDASGGEGIERAFEDIEALGDGCRFKDCRHQGEPGCAVRAAIDAGELDTQRLENYEKLQRELAFEERKADKQVMSNAKKRWKKIQNQAYEHIKRKRF